MPSPAPYALCPSSRLRDVAAIRSRNRVHNDPLLRSRHRHRGREWRAAPSPGLIMLGGQSGQPPCLRMTTAQAMDPGQPLVASREVEVSVRSELSVPAYASRPNQDLRTRKINPQPPRRVGQWSLAHSPQFYALAAISSRPERASARRKSDALQSGRHGVPRLVQQNGDAAGQIHLNRDAPPFVFGLALEGYALGLQLAHRSIDVVTHE